MPKRTHILALATVLVAGLAGSAAADKKQFRYVGIHPIAKAHGGGFCHIEAPHVHAYAAADVKVQYRDHDGFQYFVGDPVAYGWDGPKHAYYGHHPVPVHVVVGDDHEDTEFCYLDGAHYHAWAPPADLKLVLKGDAYWYMGDFPKAYVEAKPVYDPIDVVYKPIVYERPAVVVDVAPPGWYGLVVAAPAASVRGRPAAHVHGGAVIEAGVHVHVPPPPTVRVEVGLPSVHVGIGGGVIVEGGHGHHHHKHKHKHKKWKRRR
ncbi:MAG TPA: hypothetical protein VM734_29025 [Kofleriaceae bacterium]|nr:hypothetical protein [Kofleriaceae bacterium]